MLNDLPAEIYKPTINYKDIQNRAEIFPGQVTYFTFTDKNGFEVIPPPEPRLEFLPITPTVTPTP